MNRPIICVDFDGVIHSYTTGWQGANIASDPPVPGAIEWLRALIEGDQVEPQIYSSRSRQEGGILCMKEWLIRHGLPVELADALQFPTQKPAAFLTIDDRAICFDGDFPSAADMLSFVPWNKQNIVELGVITSHDIPAERVLRAALKAALKNVVVMGYDADGGEYFCSSIADGGTVNWLADRMKRQLLKIGDGEAA